MVNKRIPAETAGCLREAMAGHRFIPIGLLLGILMLGGCTGPTTFRVLDAETREPIEGTVAIAMWERTKGFPGLSSRYTARAVEAETDANGYFTIPAVIGTLALQTPHLKVYKPGYVGWDSRRVYLGCVGQGCMTPRSEKREGFSMKNHDLYLESWREEYSYISHQTFTNDGLIGLHKAGMTKSKYLEALEHERPFIIRETNYIFRKVMP